MELKLSVATHVVDFINKQTGFSVIVCDHAGTITADSAKTRIGKVHHGAKSMLAYNKDFYAVTKEEAAASGGTMKEGYNLAIKVDGRRIGSFGIAGSLEVVTPVAQIAAALVAKILRDDEVKVKIQNQAETVLNAISQAVAYVENINASSQEMAATSQAVALSLIHI